MIDLSPGISATYFLTSPIFTVTLLGTTKTLATSPVVRVFEVCRSNGKLSKASFHTGSINPLDGLFMPRHQKVAGYYVIPSEILSVRPSVRPSVCLSVRPSVRPSVSAHHHSCIGNSSYSFRPILLKLYRCFKDGLKICILFFQNPEIIFYHFFPIFNLDIFRALILQICIWSMYLVSATPPTVFGESFWNFTGVLRMVWRYAYCFFRILKLFFITFFRIFNLDIFRALILQICIWSMYLVSATPPTVFGESFWNFTGVLRMVWRYAYCFFRILKLFFITFYAFLT